MLSDSKLGAEIATLWLAFSWAKGGHAIHLYQSGGTFAITGNNRSFPTLLAGWRASLRATFIIIQREQPPLLLISAVGFDSRSFGPGANTMA